MLGHQAFQVRRGRHGLRPLTIEEDDARPRSRFMFSSRRYARCTVSLLLVLFALVLLCKLYSPDALERMRYEGMTLYAPTERPQPPSLFAKYSEQERRLSQDNVKWWREQGRQQHFLKITAQPQGAGWGSFMQELILNSYVASRSARTLVLNNYTWHEDSPAWVDYINHDHEHYPMPIQLPVSAIVRVFAPPNSVSRMVGTITDDLWHDLCPDARATPQGIGLRAQALLSPLDSVETLAVAEERCLELSESPLSVEGSSGGSLPEIWPSLSTSAVLSHFAWSPLVELAFDMNRELISPMTELEPYLSTLPFTNSAGRYRAIPGLLALHIPRGIHQDYCRSLVADSQGFTGFNALPFLPDAFDPSALADLREPDRKVVYHRRCLPIIQEIVRRVDSIRRSPTGRGLRSIYIATNGQTPWLLELKTALRRMGGWASVSSTRDLILNREQRYVKQAVDMLVGQRAQVFVGNGFSAESGQVVMLRTANGFPINSTRHW